MAFFSRLAPMKGINVASLLCVTMSSDENDLSDEVV